MVPRLSVAVEPRELGEDPTAPSPPESGADRVEMLFSANPGEEPRPLRKIASGGELSRVTLAAKAVLAAVDRVPTLVFDEIDTGVGGRLGSALGKTLAELGRHHQVICVTHLPQMASYARRQWVIRKQVERGRSRTTIAPLDESERIAELAVMLRGDSAAEGTRQEAMAMLAEAQESAAVGCSACTRGPGERLVSVPAPPLSGRKTPSLISPSRNATRNGSFMFRTSIVTRPFGVRPMR